MSVFLVYRSVNSVPSFKITRVSRKGIRSYDQLAVNLIVGWAVFRSEFSQLGDVDGNPQTEIFFQLEHC